MRYRHAVAMLAAFTVAAQPCAAADLLEDGGTIGGRMGAFAGVRLAAPLGGAERHVLRARLQVAPSYAMLDARSGALVGARSAAGLELGVARTGSPTLSLGGRTAPELRRQLGFHGSTPYIVVGGVLLLVGLLAAVASASPKPGPRPGDF